MPGIFKNEDVKKIATNHNNMINLANEKIEEVKIITQTLFNTDFVTFKKMLSKLKTASLSTLEYLDTIEYENYDKYQTFHKRVLAMSDKVDLSMYKSKEAIKKDITTLLALSEKLTVETTGLEYLDKSSKKFGSLLKLPIPKTKDPVIVITAPMIIVGYGLSKNIESKLNEAIGLEIEAGYVLIKKAKFLGVNLKGIDNIEDFVNKYITKISKNIKVPIMPIHDISQNIKGRYFVALMPQSVAKYIHSLLDIMDDYEIYIE